MTERVVCSCGRRAAVLGSDGKTPKCQPCAVALAKKIARRLRRLSGPAMTIPKGRNAR